MKDFKTWWDKNVDFEGSHPRDHKMQATVKMLCKEAFDAGYEAAQPEWPPIESAPKDGDDIWLYDRQWSNEPQIGYWSDTIGSWLSSCGSKMKPTRWQPLPDPPI